MSLKKLCVASVLIGGGIAAATFSTPFGQLLSDFQQDRAPQSASVLSGKEGHAKSLVSKASGADERMKSTKVAAATYVEDVDGSSESKPVELDGQWRVVRALRDGEPVSFDRFASMSVKFDAGKIIIDRGSKQEVGELTATDVSMIGETSFAEVVISPIEDEQGNKEEIRGFYYHEEGELTLIWGAPGMGRPDPTDQDDFAKARILTLQVAE